MHVSSTIAALTLAFATFTTALPQRAQDTTTTRHHAATTSATASATASETASATNSAAATLAPAVPNTSDAVSTSSGGSVGKASVLNKCPFETYVYVCGQGHGSSPPSCTAIQTLAAGSGTYSETYISFVGDGRSIKVGRTGGEGAKPILQLEYTNAGSYVNYDVSDVNGNPFGSAGGFTLTTSDASCFHAKCPPPSTSCPGLFTDPTNGTPHDCGLSNDIGVTLCQA